MKTRDWTGSSNIRNCNLRNPDAAQHDYYATPSEAVEMLLELEDFKHDIWEPACGEGHISKVLEAHGHKVLSTDLIDRGYGQGHMDFLKQGKNMFGRDIITNPPYKYAKEFVEHALEISPNGTKIAMFLKIQFLEGKARRELFDTTPPTTVYVSSDRIRCAMNGDFEAEKERSATCYCWFIWHKGHHGPTNIKWFN